MKIKETIPPTLLALNLLTGCGVADKPRPIELPPPPSSTSMEQISGIVEKMRKVVEELAETIQDLQQTVNRGAGAVKDVKEIGKQIKN